jgi:hypothetical protein
MRLLVNLYRHKKLDMRLEMGDVRLERKRVAQASLPVIRCPVERKKELTITGSFGIIKKYRVWVLFCFTILMGKVPAKGM